MTARTHITLDQVIAARREGLDTRRLRFARYLVETGRIGEHLPPPAEPRARRALAVTAALIAAFLGMVFLPGRS